MAFRNGTDNGTDNERITGTGPLLGTDNGTQVGVCMTTPDGTARPVAAYGNPFAWTGQRYDPAERVTGPLLTAERTKRCGRYGRTVWGIVP